MTIGKYIIYISQCMQARSAVSDSLPLPSPGDHTNPGIKSASLAVADRFCTTEITCEASKKYKGFFFFNSLEYITMSEYMAVHQNLSIKIIKDSNEVQIGKNGNPRVYINNR